ncbi:hypothetical protein GEV33_012924 [Tenebrio molitor]|uniref:Uncharacterized protein n=1 Tax=Tenebrio molitor TaxID=7067 RepID=A0A8J6H9H0_TENMO|nr:hypothetical protein GEV33_012924 [Tenebrio molitor]
MHAGKNEAAANRKLTEPDWPSASLFRGGQNQSGTTPRSPLFTFTLAKASAICFRASTFETAFIPMTSTSKKMNVPGAFTTPKSIDRYEKAVRFSSVMTQVRATILSIAHGCLDSHMLSLHPVCGNRAVNTSNCIDGFRSLVPVQRDERGNVRIQQDIALWNGGTTPRIVPSSAASRSGSCDRNPTSELLTVAIQKLNLDTGDMLAGFLEGSTRIPRGGDVRANLKGCAVLSLWRYLEMIYVGVVLLGKTGTPLSFNCSVLLSPNNNSSVFANINAFVRVLHIDVSPIVVLRTSFEKQIKEEKTTKPRRYLRRNIPTYIGSMPFRIELGNKFFPRSTPGAPQPPPRPHDAIKSNMLGCDIQHKIC